MGLLDFTKKNDTEQKNAPAPNAPKEKILVVDDEQFLREFYQDLLTQEGYQVITASNGQEALDQTFQNNPSLILLDINMPVMDGNEVLRRLRENDTTKNTPVIILTNAGNLPNMDNAKFYSAYKLLVKSNVDPSEIIKLVREAMHPAETKLSKVLFH